MFLIPFYIFTYEAHFKAIEGSGDRLNELEKVYEDIAERLEWLARAGAINEFYKRTIMEMSELVLASIARNYGKIRKGVGAIMVGQILDYEAKRILNEGLKKGIKRGLKKGRQKGREEGHKEGLERGMLSTLAALVEDGILSFQDAAFRAGLSENEFRQKLAELEDNAT